MTCAIRKVAPYKTTGTLGKHQGPACDSSNLSAGLDAAPCLMIVMTGCSWQGVSASYLATFALMREDMPSCCGERTGHTVQDSGGVSYRTGPLPEAGCTSWHWWQCLLH